MEWKVSFALYVFVALWGESYGNAADQIQRLTASLNLKNTLNFGDKCNYESEQSRQKYIKEYWDKTKNMMGMGPGGPPGGPGGPPGVPGGPGGLNLDLKNPTNAQSSLFQLAQQGQTALVAALDSLSKLHGNLCNISQNLACLPAGSCGCAENDMSTGNTVSFEREGNACVVKAGTNAVCMPKEITSQAMDTQGGPPPPMFRSVASMASAVTCPASERCLIRDSEDECSEEKVKKKMTDMAEQAKSGKLDLGKAVGSLMEGPCVCAGTNQELELLPNLLKTNLGTNLAASILVITVSTVVGVIRRF